MENVESLTVHGATGIARGIDKRSDYLVAIVIIDSALHYGMARSMQMFEEEKRKEVRIFRDADKALDWLAFDVEERKVLDGFVNANNVRSDS